MVGVPPTKKRKLWEDTRQPLMMAALAPHMQRHSAGGWHSSSQRLWLGAWLQSYKGHCEPWKMAQAQLLGHQLAFTALMSLTRFWARQMPKI